MLPTIRRSGSRSWPFSSPLRDGFTDQLLNEMLQLSGQREETPQAWAPRCEITEKDNTLFLEAETPGMNVDDLDIEVEENVLTISGEKTFDREEKEGQTHLSERTYGRFERSFQLPASIDAEKISAHYDNGVLTVEMPKTERSRGRKIQIEGSS